MSEPLPPYTHIPGKTPHPESDPAGHSYGVSRSQIPAADADSWDQSPTYRRGIELFNAGYWWEAHVEFEALWIAAGRTGPEADFFKALVKLSAAGVKHLQGIRDGVVSHTRRAAELWADVQVKLNVEDYFGLRLSALITLAESILREGWPDPSPVLTLD